MKSLLPYLLRTKFNNPRERHDNDSELRPDILKKRLYDKDCTEQEKELIKQRLIEHRNL